MNKICSKFSTKTHINMNFNGIELFNWRMLLKDNEYDFNENLGLVFCALDTAITDSVQINAKETERDEYSTYINSRAIFVQTIKEKLEDVCPLEESFPSVTEYLFTRGHDDKMFHKQLYWEIYGEIAERNLINNLKTAAACPACGTKVPVFDEQHKCNTKVFNVAVCSDCGKIIHRINPKQQRCEACQALHRKEYLRKYYKEVQE